MIKKETIGAGMVDDYVPQPGYREKMKKAIATDDKELFQEALEAWLATMKRHYAEKESRRRTWSPYKE